MKPDQVVNTLRRIASALEASKKPDKSLVAQDLKRILAIMLNKTPTSINWYQKFADYINDGDDMSVILQTAIDKNINEPAQEGAASRLNNFQDLMGDPIRVINVDLEDAYSGAVTISGTNMPVQLSIPFEPEETLGDWVNYTLMEGLPINPGDVSSYPHPEYIKH